MGKIENIEYRLALLQKELREETVDLMRDYGEEKMPLDSQKEPVTVWYYDGYNAGYCKGTVCAVFYRDETLLLEIEDEYGETLQLNEHSGDLAFDVPERMIAVYRKMQEKTESEKNM
jgi:hypothetical protein